jgi:hypothetical protein
LHRTLTASCSAHLRIRAGEFGRSAPRLEDTMLNKILRVLYVILIIAVASCGKTKENATKPEPLNVNAAEEVSHKFITFLQKKDFNSAVRLCTFPAKYTQKQLDQDMFDLKKGLEIIDEEFGSITEIKPQSGSIIYFHVGLSGGDIPFLKSHTDTQQFSYEVHYSKEGSGYLNVRTCQVHEKWNVLEVKYALPAYRPFAKERVAAVLAKIALNLGAEQVTAADASSAPR